MIDRTPPQVAPVRRPDLVQPHTVVDLKYGTDDELMGRLMTVVHSCNLNDPPRLDGAAIQRRGSV
jgi:cyanobactin biosynthesis protein (PatB/AcyB/McaB family)